MSYYFSKTVDLPFEDAAARVTEELKKEGFGVLTEIDVAKTLSPLPDTGRLQSAFCSQGFVGRR